MSASLLTFYLINVKLRRLLVHDVFNELNILIYTDTYDARKAVFSIRSGKMLSSVT